MYGIYVYIDSWSTTPGLIGSPMAVPLVVFGIWSTVITFRVQLCTSWHIYLAHGETRAETGRNFHQSKIRKDNYKNQPTNPTSLRSVKPGPLHP